METTNYANIGPVLQLNKAGELTQKRMKAVKVCDGLYVTEPDKIGYAQFICEFNGVMWVDCKAAESKIAYGMKMIPGYFEKIKAGCFDGENIQEFKREISRRINRPDSPAIMELKKPERKKSAQLSGGTFRAKVLQYKSDGNTLTEKWETLTKYTEGVYYTTDDDGYGNTIHGIVFEAKGVYWWSSQALRPEELNADNIYCQKVMEKRRNFEHNIMAQAEAGQYINNLQIEVIRRLGHDVADLQAAHDEYIRQREERDRRQAEEAERRERERVEVEERRKAEVLADGKEKLLKHERITVEQIELIAEAVSYKIHIRTIGFMREKVTEAVLREDDTVTVWGRKLTSRNIDSTANVMRELCDRLKGQAEEEVKLPATPAETPQISTEAAEMVNVSVEGGNAENEPIKHISEIMETCCTWDDEKRDYTDEYKYYTWLANHVSEHKATNKNTTELILEEVRKRISAAATLAAHGVPKCDIEGSVCAVFNRLAKMEDVLQFYNRTEPPQSPETPQMGE